VISKIQDGGGLFEKSIHRNISTMDGLISTKFVTVMCLDPPDFLSQSYFILLEI